MANLTIAEALNLALKQEMKKDARVMVMGEDVGVVCKIQACPRGNSAPHKMDFKPRH